MPDRIWGDKELNVFARPYIGKVVADHVTKSIALFYRLITSRRKLELTGTHIEEPFLYRLYNVYDVYGYSTFPLNPPPESVVNLAFNMSTKIVPLAFSHTELLSAQTPDAFASLVSARTEVAKLSLTEQLARAVWRENGTSPVGPGIVGVERTVDDGSVSPTYGGQSRTTYAGLSSVLSSAGSMTLAALQNMWSLTRRGGSHATVIFSRDDQYNKYLALLQTQQRFVKTAETDRFMADAGFTNVLFNGAPWIPDDYVPDATGSATSSKIYFLNENWWTLYINKLDNFVASQFAQPTNQRSYVSNIAVTLQLVCRNPSQQGVFTNMLT